MKKSELLAHENRCHSNKIDKSTNLPFHQYQII
jgi:hypothetical protein